MVTKSSNTSGNPYHDEGGKFTSKDGSGSAAINSPVSDQIKGLSDKIKGLFSSGAGKKVKIQNLFSKTGSNSFQEKQELDSEIADFWEQVKNYSEDTPIEKDSIPPKKETDAKPDMAQEESISLLSEEESYETVLNDKTLDPEKLKNATEAEIKELLSAKAVLLNKYQDSELESLNKQTFYDLWVYPVKPSDYIDKKGNIEAKKNYFLDTYKGSDKEEKLAALDKFVESGKAYEEAKKGFDEKYERAEKIVNKYKNPAYSIEAKKNAIFVGEKENLYESEVTAKSRQLFGDQADELTEYLKETDNEAYEYLRSYTESYSSVNKPLRKVQYFGTKKAFVEHVEAMNRAIDQYTWDFDFYVLRGTDQITDKDNGINIDSGTSASDLNNLVGKEFVNHSFYSAGAGYNTGMTDKNIMIKTYCPKGVKAFYVEKFSHYSGENEMILQRGYTYRITSAKRVNGQILLDAEVILDSDSTKWDHNQLVDIASKYISG